MSKLGVKEQNHKKNIFTASNLKKYNVTSCSEIGKKRKTVLPDQQHMEHSLPQTWRPRQQS
jgi:hypothetical protein